MLTSSLGWIQLVVSGPIILPILYWIWVRIMNPHESDTSVMDSSKNKVTILVPMRNEERNVIRKLDSIINEIIEIIDVEILVIESGSIDSTASIAKSFLEDSEIDDERWKVVTFPEPGKSLAINKAIEMVNSDIIIMTDCDAKVSPGWMGVLMERFADEQIGVVSGIEDESCPGLNRFNKYYRTKSNYLRMKESLYDSTPVLEGSLIAWDVRKIGKFEINAGINADDAQIGMMSIRKGFRSIIDPRIVFQNFDDKKRSVSESVRRAQGLSIVLAMNADLAIFSMRKRARLAIANAIILYSIFPWMVLIFAVNSALAFYHEPVISLNWQFLSMIATLGATTIPSGRMVLIGVYISLVAHIQALIGKRHNVWNPVR